MLPLALCALGVTGCKDKAPEQVMNDNGELDAPLPTPEPFDESIFDQVQRRDPQAMVGLNWEAPAGWSDKDDPKYAWLENWKIPGASEHVLAFAFSFGAHNTQSRQINVDRWTSQFRTLEGQRPEPVLETWEQDDLTITTVTITGQSMTGLLLDALELGVNGAKMVGVIVEGGPNGFVLFRLSGPTAEVDKHTPEFLELIRSIKRRDDAPSP